MSNKSDRKSERPLTHSSSGVELDHSPQGWPLWVPWPPTSTGSVLPIAASSETTEETGIRWYELQVHPETACGNIAGINDEMQEVSRLEFNMSSEREFRWLISNARTKVAGTISVNDLSSHEVRANGKIDQQEFSIILSTDRREPVEMKGKICIDAPKIVLIHQWNRIGESLVRIGEAIRLRAGDSGTAAGCFGCAASGAGLVIGTGACAASLGIGCAGVALGWIGFLSNCRGACA